MYEQPLRVTFLGFVAGLAAGCTTTAVERAGSAAQASAEPVAGAALQPTVVEVGPARPSADDLICRLEEVTGTHQRRDLCLTRGERARMRSQAQEWMRSGGLTGGVTNAIGLR